MNSTRKQNLKKNQNLASPILQNLNQNKDAIKKKIVPVMRGLNILMNTLDLKDLKILAGMRGLSQRRVQTEANGLMMGVSDRVIRVGILGIRVNTLTKKVMEAKIQQQAEVREAKKVKKRVRVLM